MKNDQLVPPAFLTAPDYYQTLGPEVVDLGKLCYFEANPEQQLILEHQFAFDRRGRFTSFEVAIFGARQNVKTGALKLGAIGKIWLLRRPLLVWTAHLFDTAQESFLELCTLIESAPELDRHVKKIHYGNGDEQIELKWGSRIKFKARNAAKGGRGFAGDDVDWDEAMFLQAQHIGALMPIMSTKPNPQMTYAGSGGLAGSKVQRGLRNRGRRPGGDRRLTYVEWTSERKVGEKPNGDPIWGPPPCRLEDCDHTIRRKGCILDNREVIQLSNPSLERSAPPSISWEYIVDERRTLSATPEGIVELLRERHMVWDDTEDDGDRAFDPQRWARLAMPAAPKPSKVWAYIAASPDGKRFSVGVAGAGPDGKTLLLVKNKSGKRWVVKRLKAMKDRGELAGVALNPNTQASAVVADLKAAGIEFKTATGVESGEACTG
ncbi:MAG TPA: hypothetical protein VFS26_03835, partial [Solirubrobacterales bacterium]|nr:hypothetical protein [Solirubrobacterales bacterium]